MTEAASESKSSSSSSSKQISEPTESAVVVESPEVKEGYRAMSHALAGDVRALKEDRIKREAEIERLRAEREKEADRVKELSKKAEEAELLKSEMAKMQAVFEEMKNEKAEMYTNDLKTVDSMFDTIEKEVGGDKNPRLKSSVEQFKNTLEEGAKNAFMGTPDREAAFQTVRACASVLKCSATKAEELFNKSKEDKAEIEKLQKILEEQEEAKKKLVEELEKIKADSQNVMKPQSHFQNNSNSSNMDVEEDEEDNQENSKAKKNVIEVTAQASNQTRTSGFDEMFKTRSGSTSWRKIPLNITATMMQTKNRLPNHNSYGR